MTAISVNGVASGTTDPRGIQKTSDGRLWVASAQSGSIHFWYSTDNGNTWTDQTSSTLASMSPLAMFVDANDNFFLTVQGAGSSQQILRGTYTSGVISWGTAFTLSTAGIGTASLPYEVIAFTDPATPTSQRVFVLATSTVALSPSPNVNSQTVTELTVTNAGTWTSVGSTSFGAFNPSNASAGSIEFQHTGDGKTPARSTPDFYFAAASNVTGGASKGFAVTKFSWNASTSAYLGTAATLVANTGTGVTATVGAATDFQLMFDGTNLIFAGHLGTVGLFVYDNLLTSPTLTTVTYTGTSDTTYWPFSDFGFDIFKNLVQVGAHAGSAAINYRVFNRSSATWGSATAAGATFGSSITSFSVRPWPSASETLSLILDNSNGFAMLPDLWATAPAAATLLTPGNGVYEDLSGTPTFVAKYNSTDFQPANAYAFRRKLSGGSYVYWNATSNAFQSGIVWNATSIAVGGNLSITFPSAAWANSNTYNWSVAFQESAANIQGSFASDFTVTGQLAPVVTVTGPTGTINVTTPIITWTVTFPGGGTQTFFHYKIFSQAQYSAVGFDPSSSTATYDSGLLSGAGTSSMLPVSAALAAGISYRAYVQVTNGTGSSTNAWTSFNSFTVGVDVPAPPILTLTPGNDPTTGEPEMSIFIQETDNYLTVADSSFEQLGWTWISSQATLVTSATFSLDGAASLRATGNGGSPLVITSGFYPIAPNTRIIAGASFRAAATVRSCQVQLKFFDSTHTVINLVPGTAANDAVGSWTLLTSPAGGTVSPSNAAYFEIILQISGVANTEIHYIDCVAVRPGSTFTWFRGGLVGTSTVEVQVSTDGVTWGTDVYGASAVVPSSTTQTATVEDLTSAPGDTVFYRAQVFNANGGSPITSAWSSVVSGATVPGIMWWLKDPLTPGTALPLNLNANATLTRPEKAATKVLLGRNRAVTITDGLLGVEGALQVGALDPSFTKLNQLIASTITLLLQSPFGEQWFIRFGASTSGTADRSSTRQYDSLLVPYGGINAPFAEADAP